VVIRGLSARNTRGENPRVDFSGPGELPRQEVGDVRQLYSAGVRAVVSLLNIP
jgi:hypothetical protein